MKTRIRRNGKSHRRELVITPEKGESLNPKESSWLVKHPHRTFLPYHFSYGKGSQDVILYYDIDGLISVGKYIKSKYLTESQIAMLLVDVALSQIWCSKNGYRYFSMIFDPKYVFVDNGGRIAFVFIPFEGMQFRVENSPLTLLSAIGNTKRIKVANHNASVLVDRIGDYVLNENGVFSLNRLRQFIKAECWIDIDTDGSVKRVKGSHIESAVETNGYDFSDINHGYEDNPKTDDGTLNGDCVFIRCSNNERQTIPRDRILYVGRGSECQVRLLGNSKVGRKHLVIKCEEDCLIIQDLDSTNGTVVESERLGSNYAVQIAYGTEFLIANEPCVVVRTT